MSENQVEIRIQRVVKEPQISLTMISRYVVAKERRRLRILQGCKYPPSYIPRFYEMARKLVCELLEGNFLDQQDLYFEEFKRQANIYRREARDYPENRDPHKNRIFPQKV